MRMIIAIIACAAAFALAPHARAQPAPPPAATISEAAWLQGYWDGEGMGGTVEDLWMPPRAGVMLGSFRLLRPAGEAGSFYELFAIEEFEGSLRFVAKHFHLDWLGWEEKDKALRLRLTRISPTQMTFGGLVFKREGADGLVVELTRRGRDGAPTVDTMRFRKKPL